MGRCSFLERDWDFHINFEMTGSASARPREARREFPKTQAPRALPFPLSMLTGPLALTANKPNPHPAQPPTVAHPDDPTEQAVCRCAIITGTISIGIWLQVTDSRSKLDTTFNVKRHQQDNAPGHNKHLPSLQPCIEFSAPAKVQERVNPPGTGAVLCQPSPNDIIVASLASPGRHAPPSIMPSRTKKTCGGGHYCMTTAEPACVSSRQWSLALPSTHAEATQSGDMGRARTIHSSRDLLFGSSLLISLWWMVRQSFLGPWRPWRLEILNARLHDRLTAAHSLLLTQQQCLLFWFAMALKICCRCRL